jgi:hypothetical protein
MFFKDHAISQMLIANIAAHAGQPLLRDNLRSMLSESNFRKTAGKSCIVLGEEE